VTGLRLVVHEGSGSTGRVLADVALAPGASWVAGPGARWRYDAGPLADGIRRATLREVAPLPAYQARRAYAVAIDARGPGVPVALDGEPHTVSLLLDAAAPTARCADQTFEPAYAVPAWRRRWDGACRTRIDGTGLRCRSGSVRYPCRVSLAVDELRCLLAAVARAEEAHHVAYGAYCSMCTGLLDIPQPPFTTWIAVGTTASFSAAAAHSAAPGLVCRWESARVPALSCGAEPW